MPFELGKGARGKKAGFIQNQTPDPLADVEYTGNASTDSKREFEALGKALKDSEYKERAKRERKRFVDATDSEFWVALAFENRQQKEEFLRKFKLLALGDKFLNGSDVEAVLSRMIEGR